MDGGTGNYLKERVPPLGGSRPACADLLSTTDQLDFWWQGHSDFRQARLQSAIEAIREPVYLVREEVSRRFGVALDGTLVAEKARDGAAACRLVAVLPAIHPESLGDRSFCQSYGLRFPYIAGEMANGIATTKMVIAMADNGMLGFFGAAGLPLARIEQAVDELESALGDGCAWGINLIHSPNDPALEERLIDLFLRRRVRYVSASAFTTISPGIVRYTASGLTIDRAGTIQRRNHLFAKISRAEVAREFLLAAPKEILERLVSRSLISPEEARLAARVPVAGCVTAEADSAGHTDNRPLVVLLPSILALRDRISVQQEYQRSISVGAAGGLGTPAAIAAAFALGASYVLTGSVNQAAVESGLSDAAKRMLAQAESTDVIMAPAADMFEQGTKVQILKRGTMFGLRALKLYELYNAYSSLESIPSEIRTRLEKDYFRASIEAISEETMRFWENRNRDQVRKAERDPKHRMALVFRWYLGQASRWAINGETSRKMDYQIWCGPAMGAFNHWVADSFLAEPQNRTVAQIALNLLEGAAVITRAQQFRSFGVNVPQSAFRFRPRPISPHSIR